MKYTTHKGKTYTVTTSEPCTITTDTGIILCSAEPGKQAAFVAIGSTIEVDSEVAEITETASKTSSSLGFNAGKDIQFTGNLYKTNSEELDETSLLNRAEGDNRWKINFDTAPTSGSAAAVTSGGLYNMLCSSKIKLGNGTGGTGSGSINIGFGESTVSQASAVGIGQNIWNVAAESVTIGNSARSYANASVVVGGQARIYNNSVSRSVNGIVIGSSSNVGSGYNSMVIGANSNVSGSRGSVIGPSAALKDESVMLLSVLHGSGANTTSQTLLYLMAANSPLATTYENGEACLGYVVKDSSGNILACGTRKLSELLTNNTAFAPAALDLDAPAPTPFLPTGITDPIELHQETEQ